MAKDQKDNLERLENHLMSDAQPQAQSARVYNGDKTDVDLDALSQELEGKPKRNSFAGVVIVLLLLVLGAFLYLVWGGRLPWS